ncbi:MAG TPA: ABC transporter permease [Ktedonobacterales bacterium]
MRSTSSQIADRVAAAPDAERAAPLSRPPASRLPALRRSLPLALASLPLLLFLLIPLLALVLRVSPSELLSRLVAAQAAQAISLSLFTTLVTLALTLLAGTPLAYLLARRSFPGKVVLDTLLDLPIVLPPAVAGIALLVAFGRLGLVGRWLDAAGIQVAFTPVAVVLAQTFVAAPLYVKTASAAFAATDRELEQAAALDGAGSLRVFRYITLPLALPTLLAGAVMTWARALGEFGATIIFAGNFPGRTQTMPLAIYLGFELDLQTALALSLVLLVVSFGVLLVVKGGLRQRIAMSI